MSLECLLIFANFSLMFLIDIFHIKKRVVLFFSKKSLFSCFEGATKMLTATSSYTTLPTYLLKDRESVGNNNGGSSLVYTRFFNIRPYSNTNLPLKIVAVFLPSIKS